MFSKVLVANRGEIAVRIFRSLKAMGIRSVAVYSDADVHALHVATADEALALGGMTAAESYLRIDLIIDLATAAGVQAIHPGYGFLSENAQFAEACEAAGIAFIGPTSHHIHEFGLKHRARQLAEDVALPCTAGTGLLATVEEAVEQANAIGYPVILKNTGGGGGIGIQVCRSKEDLEGCFEALKRIGEQQFSNAGLFLEQYIEHGRHVEVQIFGDGRGGIAVLGDRDCSVQRRNQKIVEEAPAPNIPEATRAAMHSSAKRLGESVAYRSAGTVEFIYDFLADKFYFLEVNTRIQVQ
jgi:urea carboxylase